jgi:hypothetical protein
VFYLILVSYQGGKLKYIQKRVESFRHLKLMTYNILRYEFVGMVKMLTFVFVKLTETKSEFGKLSFFFMKKIISHIFSNF